MGFREIVYLNPLEGFRGITSEAIIFDISQTGFVPESVRTLANQMARTLNQEILSEAIIDETAVFSFDKSNHHFPPTEDGIKDLYQSFSLSF